MKEKKDFLTVLMQSAHGPVQLVLSVSGIARAEFRPRKSEFKNPASDEPNMQKWIPEIRSRIAGKQSSHPIPLDFHGTTFQKTVWKALCRIPHGEVRTYKQIAKAIGKPRAFRAVASACGANRIAVLVPCHRVVRSDGSIGKYHWGMKLKRRLLESEGVLLPLNL